MSKKEGSTYSQEMSRALFQTLIKHTPPKTYSPLLEEVVNALMESLSRGELERSIHNHNKNELNRSELSLEHKEALLTSGWLTGVDSPMVLENNQLSWRRWHNELNDVVHDLIQRSRFKYEGGRSQNSINVEISSNNEMLDQDQQLAIEVVSKERVILLSGGPGTGKTSTIMQMLERALCLSNNLKIGLAAPTGKAARRLQASIHKGIKTLDPLHKEALYAIPCNTLHRWLEAGQQGFAKNKQNPLFLDLLVIDEMSMVDLALMKALLKALPKSSQLLLVGDPNQLPPIGSGAIWHQLHKKKFRIHFKKGAIHLRKDYRNRGEVASLSKVLCEQGIHSFWRNLAQASSHTNFQTHDYGGSSIPPLLIKRLTKHSKKLENFTQLLLEKLPKEFQVASKEDINLGKEEEQLLCCLEELTILCPKHYGRWGVDEVHKAFLGSLKDGISSWPQGTPIMCNTNQPELQLANGDIGVVVGQGKSLRILFRIFSEERKLITRFIHPARLKALKPAFAMTIHKAQGSEADEVILLWPESSSRSSHKNQTFGENRSYEERLLYTAITRTRKKIDLIIKPNKQINTSKF